MLAVAGYWILGLFGPEFPKVWGVMLAITVARLIDILFGPTSEILLMSGYHREASRLNTVLMVANILLNVTLIPLLGLWGAVLATSLIVIIWNVYQYRLVRRALAHRRLARGPGPDPPAGREGGRSRLTNGGGWSDPRDGESSHKASGQAAPARPARPCSTPARWRAMSRR